MNDNYRSTLEYHADLRTNPGNFTCKASYRCSFVDEDRHCGYATTRLGWSWKYVFTASTHDTDSATGLRHRHQIHESVVQKALQEALRRTGITKPASCQMLRHCFATHLLEYGYDILTVQEFLGPKDVKTSMICAHLL